MKKLALAALITCLWTTPGAADDKFDHMDKDSSGTVTWEEFEAQYPSMKKAAFDAIDSDANGEISHDEWHAFTDSHGASGKGGMGGGTGGGMGKGGMPPGHPDTSSKGKMLIEPPKKSE
ncbi:calcium-binding protein [Desulfovibrio psychrotolerans]|uniref:Calcium-binding protein n=1 Tax=Desulfovibrio psychrotolerans TaxID=415242 RepID=A0A7J0BW46_9BACT|nr:calcium-binding protein [Desulfovibrio psychrotolerans]GFM37204.1 calcium-binding protein [Desulfovibrio psychrotolerans]